MATRSIVATTNLSIPTLRRSLLPRPQLSARLDRRQRIALVAAPAGYGKTALLASWASTVDEPLAWLSCDRSDVEPKTFLTGLLSSIAATWPGAADDAFVLLDRDGASDDAAISVANELGAVDTGGVIVIDDLHLAAPPPALLSAFVGALPATIRLVAGTRSDPPLSLARLRLGGDLLELRSDDLRFDLDETTALVALHGVDLTHDEVRELHDLTEGWPAGIQLATIAIQGRKAPDDFLGGFARTDHSVGDFLLGEVLESLDDTTVDFLMETSVLDSFDAEICAEVTGADDAALVIERLLAANLFIVPVNLRDHIYRYHHLFGSFLRARLASHGNARVREAHERAGRALEDRGDVVGALQHALVLHDADRAGEVLRAAISRSMSLQDGNGTAIDAIRLWLHERGADAVASDPITLVEVLVGLVSVGGIADVATWLKRVEAAHPARTGELASVVDGAWTEYHVHLGHVDAANASARAAMAAVDGRPPENGLLSVLHAAVIRSHLLAEDLDEARIAAETALADPVGSAIPDDVRYPGVAAYVFARCGDLSRAEDLAAAAVLAADRYDLGGDEPARIFAALTCVEVHLERQTEGLGDAIAALEAARERTERHTLRAAISFQQARVARSTGDETAAAGHLVATRMLRRDPDPAMLEVLAHEEAAQAVTFDPAGAVAQVDALDSTRAATTVLRARLALAEGNGRAAMALLVDLPPTASRRDTVMRAVLRALSVLDRDVEAANVHLRDAICAEGSQGLVQTFLDCGPDVHRLLKSYPPAPDEQAYVDRLLLASGRGIAPVRRSPRAADLVVPLSEREVTVLRYLCSHLTYQEIAAALFVSRNTLKSHVRSVYRKLGASSRAEAVAAGREHALI